MRYKLRRIALFHFVLLISAFMCAPLSLQSQGDYLELRELTPITIDNVGELSPLISFDSGSKPIASAFGSDTYILAYGNLEGTITLWTPKSGFTSLTGHTKAVSGVVFTNSDKSLISGSFDSTLRLWDIEQGQTQSVFASIAPIWSIASAPHKELIAFGDSHGIVHLRSSDLRRDEGTLQTAFGWTVTSLSFNDSEQILAASYANGLWLWDIESQNVIDILTDDATNYAHFSPPGTTIISENGNLHFWDSRAFTETPVQPQQSSSTPFTNNIAISPDGNLLASGSYDNAVRIWNTATGEILTTLQGHTDIVTTVAFNYDGTLLASGDLAGQIIIWGT